MSSPELTTRRDALKRAATVAAVALPFLSATSRLTAADAAPAAAPSSARERSRRLNLGVASISLKDLAVESVIGVLQHLEIDQVSIFRTHALFEKGTPEDCRATAQKFRNGGINPWTTSVVNLINDEAAVRQAFDNVRTAGMTMMTCKPLPEALPLVERFVQEYDIRLAIHNHGPEDEVYPSPYEALKRIEKLDPRIGLCIDVGHTMRAGADPAKAIRESAPRLFDMHIKDSTAAPGVKKDIPTEVGRGQIDIEAVLQALLDVKYSGAVAFEYERFGVNSIAGLAESVGYVRGMLAAM
jgi:inosose dehydratase